MRRIRDRALHHAEHHPRHHRTRGGDCRGGGAVGNRKRRSMMLVRESGYLAGVAMQTTNDDAAMRPFMRDEFYTPNRVRDLLRLYVYLLDSRPPALSPGEGIGACISGIGNDFDITDKNILKIGIWRYGIG